MTEQAQDRLREAAAFIAAQVSQGKVGSRAQLEKLKKKAAAEFHLDRYVTNAEILRSLRPAERVAFRHDENNMK